MTGGQAPARPVHDPASVGLVALDVDGTLTAYNDQVSDRVRTAIHALRAAGIEPVIATGRSIGGVLAVARVLELDQTWAVCSNGSITGRIDASEPTGFKITNLVTFDARRVAETVRAHHPPALFAREDLAGGFWITGEFPPMELHGSHRLVSFDELVATSLNRLVVRAPELSREEMVAMLASFEMDWVTYDVGWSAWADIVAAGLSKATGLETLRRDLGVPASGTVAFGDGSNDTEMLAWASRGVAMGGSQRAVVAAASEEGPSLNEDGVAVIVEEILGGRVRDCAV